MSQQPNQSEHLKGVATVFISYAHRDEPYANELRLHLKTLERQGIIRIFTHNNLPPGELSIDAIEKKIEDANMFLLLISPDYLASDFLYEIEMRRALERHQAGQALVIPIILRPSNWEDTPICRLQILPDNAVPISMQKDADKAWNDVTKNIRRLINNI